MGQCDVVLQPQLILKGTMRGSTGLMPLQQPQSQMPSQAYASYAMCPLQVNFSFRVEHLPVYVMYWYQLWCLPSAFRFPCGYCVHLWGLKHWGL